MFISKITTENWLGLPSLSTALTAFTLFAGPNGAGKTSLLEAVRFCLFNDYPRGVEKKGELPALLSRGAERGEVTVRAGERDVTRRVHDGAIGKVAPPPMPAMAWWILSPTTFSARPEGERRAALAELLQVKTTPDAIAERLTAAKLPAVMVDELRGVLTRGFAAAAKHAKEKASEARGAWKEITGENYGSTKGAEWKPPSAIHVPSQQELDETEAALVSTRAEINGVNQAIGAASRGLSAEDRAQLAKSAGKLEDYLQAQTRGMARREQVQAEVTRLNTEIEGLQASLSGTGGTTTPCPHCQQAVVIDRGYLKKPDEGLAPAERQIRVDALAQAQQQFNEAVAARAAVDEGLGKVADAIVTARAAARQLEAAGDETETEDPEQLQAKLRDLQVRESQLREQAALQRNQRAAAASLEGAELRAAIEHQRVLDYVRAEEMLGPNGIPSILVAQTLDPVNAELAAVAKSARWPTVRIDAELVLHFGDTPYPLCSESEQWRCDAAMAYTLAKLADFKVLMLDRVDVLVDTGKNGGADVRVNVFAWLHGLSKSGWQVIAAGSFKTPPRFPDVSTVWLDASTTGRAAA